MPDQPSGASIPQIATKDDPATSELLAALDALYPLTDDSRRERAGRTAAVVKRFVQRVHDDIAAQIPAILARLASEPRQAPAGCVWSMDDVGGESQWETGCKHEFYFDGADGPLDAGFTVCPFCGRTLSEERTSLLPPAPSLPEGQ